mmetsp:Transcript_33427/g.40485  ORF Transcript_33427/g.40485 Transcript_33427/m.40485 type:complete len:89 (+) Transcript_33427:1743-2009(+)
MKELFVNDFSILLFESKDITLCAPLTLLTPTTPMHFFNLTLFCFGMYAGTKDMLTHAVTYLNIFMEQKTAATDQQALKVITTLRNYKH